MAILQPCALVSPDDLAGRILYPVGGLAAGESNDFTEREGGVQLRVAKLADAEAISTLINSAFRAAESFLFDRDRINLESVQSLLETGRFLVADDGGVLAGCVYLERRGEGAYLGLLSVDPHRQKAGVGSKLMKAAEDYCVDTGCRFVELQIVNLRRELPDFYRRRGYVVTGTAPFTPGHDPKLPCHFIKMAKPLT